MLSSSWECLPREYWFSWTIKKLFIRSNIKNFTIFVNIRTDDRNMRLIHRICSSLHIRCSQQARCPTRLCDVTWLLQFILWSHPAGDWRSPGGNHYQWLQAQQPSLCRWYSSDGHICKRPPKTFWCERLGFRVNSKETKCKMVSKSEVPPTCSVKQRKKETQQVSPFNHLGALVNSDARCKKEIWGRIGLAKDTFPKLGNILQALNANKNQTR